MKNLMIGVHIAGTDPRKVVGEIAAAEKVGVQCAWMTSGGVSLDPLAVFAAAAVDTQHIAFGSSIVPTSPRHPLALVQSALVVDGLAPGQLRLGIGPSHQPTIERTYGLAFERPLEQLREYLIILRTLFESGRVDFDGKRLSAHAQLPHPLPVTVMASALRPASFRLCGEVAEGAISWVCPLPYLRDVAVPAIREGAAKAQRQPPPLVAHVPVLVSEDRAAVRRIATERLGHYPGLPFYAWMFEAAGFPEAGQGQLSERMIDALVVSGSAEQVKERLRAVPSFGASELLAMPLREPADERIFQRTIETLGELARE